MKISARFERSTGNIWEVRLDTRVRRPPSAWDEAAMRGALALYAALCEVQRAGNLRVSRTGFVFWDQQTLVWTFSYDADRSEQFHQCVPLEAAERQRLMLVRISLEEALSAVLQTRRLTLGNALGMGGALYALERSEPDRLAFGSQRLATGALTAQNDLYERLERHLNALDWTQARARYTLNGELYFAVQASDAVLSGVLKANGTLNLELVTNAALPTYQTDNAALQRAIEIAPCAHLHLDF